MVNVIVTGVAGRMGGQILRMIPGAEGLRVVGAVERPGWSGPGDAGVAAGMPSLGIPVTDDLAGLLGRVEGGARLGGGFQIGQALAGQGMGERIGIER